MRKRNGEKSRGMLGMTHTKDARKRISFAKLGEKNPNWIDQYHIKRMES